MDAYDKYDHELCGTEKPHPVISEGPRLVMVFSSGELQGRGFKVGELICIRKSYHLHNESIIRQSGKIFIRNRIQNPGNGRARRHMQLHISKHIEEERRI